MLVSSMRESADKRASYTITNESSLVIKGNSNINSFTCTYDINNLKSPIPASYSIEDNKLYFEKTTLILDNIDFDCGGRGINNDFQKTLNTEEYPQIRLNLKKIEATGNPSEVQATIVINIAGHSQSYKIPLSIKRNNNLQVSGQLDIQLSDYNLTAPKKLFGMITIDDTIEIIFNLSIKEN